MIQMYRLKKFIAKGNNILGWRQFYEIYIIQVITYESGNRDYCIRNCRCKNNMRTDTNISYVIVQKNNIHEFERVMTKFENLLQ